MALAYNMGLKHIAIYCHPHLTLKKSQEAGLPLDVGDEPVLLLHHPFMVHPVVVALFPQFDVSLLSSPEEENVIQCNIYIVMSELPLITGQKVKKTLFLLLYLGGP